MATPTYNVNYEDEKFKQVEAEKEVALNNVNNTYNNMINQSDQYYQDQINAAKDYANTQSQIQQDNTNFTIEQINQQKEQAEKDYTKEQKGAYVDWQKQSNQYGANAEQMAANGLTNTGYSESSQVSMYNQYQGRVATARESYNQAVLNYNNSIKEAQLANNSALAEIAYKALQTQLELSLQGFQYKNELLSTQLQMQQQTDDRYYSRWQDVLTQMNQENQFKESIRQYEQNYQLQTKQFEEEKRQFQLSYTQQIKEFNESIRQFNEEITRLKKKDAQEHKMEIQRLELQKQQLEQAKQEADREYQLKVAQLNESKRQADLSYKASTQSYNYTDTGNQQSDAQKYGTFSNRYQPKGISGYGELSKSKLKVQDVFNELGTSFGKQNIWTAGGHYFVWDGASKDYVDVTTKVNESLKNKVNFEWGR